MDSEMVWLLWHLGEIDNTTYADFLWDRIPNRYVRERTTVHITGEPVSGIVGQRAVFTVEGPVIGGAYCVENAMNRPSEIYTHALK